MNNRKRNFIENGIIIPAFIAVVVTVLFLIVYGSFSAGNSLIKDKHQLTDFLYCEITNAEAFGADGSDASGNKLPEIEDNSVIGSAALGFKDMSLIFNANELNSSGRLNVRADSVLIGEAGCAYLYCNKKDSAAVRLLKKGDVVKIDTCYNSCDCRIVKSATVKNDVELNRIADDIPKAVVFYTDAAQGAGIGNGYYVVVAEVINGNTVG